MRTGCHRSTRGLAEGDSVTLGGLTGKVLDVPGHTTGHIAFHFPQANALFTADSLMARRLRAAL